MYLGLTTSYWKEDPFCSSYRVGFGEDLPITGLVSFPGSGNTWIRYLIESVTGIFTGSVYEDEFLNKTGKLTHPTYLNKILVISSIVEFGSISSNIKD